MIEVLLFRGMHVSNDEKRKCKALLCLFVHASSQAVVTIRSHQPYLPMVD